jgi:hypothetical protein
MSIALRAIREDGSVMAIAQSVAVSFANFTVEDIPETDIYRYTRHRWVYAFDNPLPGHVC